MLLILLTVYAKNPLAVNAVHIANILSPSFFAVMSPYPIVVMDITQ